MKTWTTALVLSALMASPAIAAVTDADLQADQRAIAKDNAALARDKARLAHHRAEKAHAKATRNYSEQAAASTKIGADKAAINEKRAERNVDQRIMRHDEDEVETEQQ